MKKILATVISLIFLLILTYNAFAQDVAVQRVVRTAEAALAVTEDIKKGLTLEDLRAEMLNSEKNSPKEYKKAERLYNQFRKTLAYFEKRFPSVTDAHWRNTNDCFTGSFEKDGFRNTVFYSKGGLLRYHLVSYPPEQLPAEVREQFLNAFTHHSLKWAHEIHHFENTIYLAILENPRNIKWVTMWNGEVNVYKEFFR